MIEGESSSREEQRKSAEVVQDPLRIYTIVQQNCVRTNNTRGITMSQQQK
jgi:hypothetical protein